MDLQSVNNTLRTQALSGQICLDDALLGTSTVDALIQANLYRNDILISVATDAIPTLANGATTFVVHGALPSQQASSFLQLVGNDVQVTFTQNGDQVDFVLEIQLNRVGGTQANWDFSKSYNAYYFSAASYLPAQNQVFQFATWDADAQLPAGLNYGATASLTGPYTMAQILTALAGHPLQDCVLQAPVLPAPGMTVTMNAQTSVLAASLDLSVMTISDMGIAYLLGANADVTGEYVGAAMFGLNARADFGSATLVSLETQALLYYQGNSTNVQLLIIPAEGTTCSIYDIGTLMGGQDWTALFTGASQNLLENYLQNFGFKSYATSIQIDSAVTVGTSQLTVGSLVPIEVIPGKLWINYFDVTWALVNPMSTAMGSLSLSAEVKLLDDILFDAVIAVDTNQVLRFYGTMNGDISVPVGDWINSVLHGLGFANLPANVVTMLDGFTLEEVEIDASYGTDNSSFHLAVNGQYAFTGTQIDFSVGLHFQYVGSVLSFELDCTGLIGGSKFRGTFATNLSDYFIQLSWENESNPLGLEAIAESLGFSIPDIPPSLDLSLTEISLTYNTNPTELILTANSASWGQALLTAFVQDNEWVFAFALDIGKSINLSNLPLIGKVLSGAETLAITEIQVMVNSQPITATMASDINGRLPEGTLHLPANGVNSVIGFAIVFDFAGLILPLSLGFGGGTEADDVPEKSTANGATIGTPSGNTSNPVMPANPAASDGTIWINVQKTFGPVNIQKVGVRFENDVLWFLLTAEMTVAGLSVSLNGLSVGTPLATFEPHFNLDGMGLDFKTPGFELGGALLNMRLAPPDFEYAGIAVVEAFGVGLGLVGAYGQVDGNATMFVFGQLTGLALGQPYLMVTGFSGGLGYNSSLRLPGIDEVAKFPFVAGLTDSSAVGGVNATPMDVLNVLMGKTGGKAWVSPDPGQYWIAAGLDINSFGIVDINALAVLEFGNELEVSLIGLATAQFPPEGIILAKVQLQVMALYRDADGLLSISAVLSNNSFILDPQLKLTGGFAFNTWFRGPHVGDFVATFGGYHPQFAVPAWYPTVPRLGLSWSLGSLISMTGGTYMAMTPAAMMVGGSLNLNYMSGSLKAWLTAKFDAILRFLPITFDLNIGVTVGASYTQDLLFSSKTITAEIGANLHLYGPPTGGSAQVDWWVFSFSIDFGAAKQSPAPTTWSDFITLLPPPGQYCAIAATGGLAGQLPASQGDEVAESESSENQNQPAWLVKQDGLRIKVASAIPLASILLGSTSTTPAHTGSLMNILPLQQTGLQSVQRIVLRRLGTVPIEINLITEHWVVKSVTMDVPKSLWGTGPGYAVPNGQDQLVSGQLVGVELSAPDAQEGNATGAFNTELLAEVNLSQHAIDPLLHGQASSGPPPVADSHAMHTMLAELNTQSAIASRQNLASALELFNLPIGPTDADLDTFTDAAGSLFQDEPLLIQNSN